MFLNAKKPVIRKVTVQKKAAPSPPPSSVSRKPVSSNQSRVAQAQSASRSTSRPSPQPQFAQKKHLHVQRDESRKRKTTPSQVLSSDSESSESEDDQISNKRARLAAHGQRCYDMRRRIWNFEQDGPPVDNDGALLDLLTGANLVEEKPDDFQPAFTDDSEMSHVKLRYPGQSQAERFVMLFCSLSKFALLT